MPPSESHTFSSSPLFSVESLSFCFQGQKNDIVQDISFSLGENETLCIVGESGCGKSVTALSLIALLEKDSVSFKGGTFCFGGHTIEASDYEKLAKLRGDRIAMIFQEPMTSLNPAFRIGDQIAEAIEAHKPVTRKQAMERALEVLKKVGIPAAEQRLNEYPHQLSGGMRQRVMIAMALVNEPELLIADEPTTALDVTIQLQILDLISDLQRDNGMGMIMITHDLGVVAQIATKVAVMYAGQIVEYGKAEQIFNDPQHPYTIGLMSSLPRLTGPRQRLVSIPGIVPTPDNMPPGCRFSSRCPFASELCQSKPDPVIVDDDHQVACHFAPIETRIGEQS